MTLERMENFETVVSRFQLHLLVAATKIFCSNDINFMLEVDYKLPAKGDIKQGVAFVADGMPFQISLSMMSEQIAVDIYVDGADAYAPTSRKYDPRAWETRYERYAFDDLDQLTEYFCKEISERIRQIKEQE